MKHVAYNLKVCEYFNSAAMNIDPSEKGDWFIRIYFDDTVLQRMEDREDREESEEVNSDLQTYTVKPETTPTSSGITHSHSPHRTETIVKIDYEVLNQLRKK